MPNANRCADPMRVVGEKGHSGRYLRKVSKNIREKFPFLAANARICSACRKKASTYIAPAPLPADFETENIPIISEDSRLRSGRSFQSAVSEHSSMRDSSTSQNDTDDSDAQQPPAKNCRSSRELLLEEMLNDIKEKFNSLESYSQRLQLLTVLPLSMSIRQIREEFNTTHHMATRARKLRETKGVFASPVSKAGRSLSANTVTTVRSFYEENSRMMTGTKDKISIKVNGKKTVVQKQMVLENLKELHQEFCKAYPEISIGFSKFAELRPKQCILAGGNGTHTVCVCVYHQNCKLMLDAINISTLTKHSLRPMETYKDCLARLMCVNPTPACHLNECQHCPNVQDFKNELTTFLSKAMIESVEFRVWQSTDRATLQTHKLSASEFIDSLCDRLVALKPHHFVAKQQGEFVKNKKETLKEGEILVQLDFSENYAFVVQDAAQSFHYNNDQSTVHPVVYYYRQGNEIHHQSFVVLSDSLSHNTAAVYLIQEKLIRHVKKFCNKVSTIFYVTDGAARHYKNRFLIANLLAHKEDFGVDAEIHYHATAHGKTACDGIGATLKREARRKSLQIIQGEPILTPRALFEWAKKHFNMDIFFYTKEEHEVVENKLKARFAAAKPIPGIQKNHCFIPQSNMHLIIKRYSAASDFEEFPKQKQRKNRTKKNNSDKKMQ